MEHINQYLREVSEIAESVDLKIVSEMIDILSQVREDEGRLFILGVGGSAANASHAVNDFRKIAGIESYAPTDNVSELTARTNDEGWESVFTQWLKISKLSKDDCLLILSVGGGNREKNISVNLISAIDYAKITGAKILGIVGKPEGYAQENSTKCLIIPSVNESRITPHSESFQGVIWHLMVTHPKLKKNSTKW